MTNTGKSALHFLRYLVGHDVPHTQTTEREQTVLQKHAAGKLRIVEIGVYEGFTTRRLAQSMAPAGELFAIDPFLAGRTGICWGKWIAHREVNTAGSRRNVRFIEEFSYNAKDQVQGSFDFIFIDGDHSIEGIARDWTDWSGRLSEKGIMALHDTRVPAHNPAVSELGSFLYFESHIRHDPRFQLLEQADSLSILQRVR